MATTSPDNIWTPDAGNPYALTVDLMATADSVQSALNAANGRIRWLRGTEAQRAVTTPQVGDYWTTTNTTPQRGYIGTASGWFIDRVPDTAFTPTWYNFIPGTTPSVDARYSVNGGVVSGRVRANLTSGYALNTNAMEMAPPFPASGEIDGLPIGQMIYNDSGVAWRPGITRQDPTGRIELWYNAGDTIGQVNSNAPLGYSVGDAFLFTFSYMAGNP